ncbi:dihydroorotase family protein [Sphingobacterium daejeonense]|mgnify:FL=1|jgi:dihydroorotase|uniref:Dihydroorotase family protein n=2 Tax=Sphingobacterium daejeonense TaxID=371142 RepID=A0ABW3RN89_9SPHI|nr:MULTISPECIES: dihydroorotase [Sphingobacterium]MCT1531620.1 dihydroorotase [Sphingobacterium daejeonense]
MATILINSATLVSAGHPLHLSTVDLLVKNGKIEQIGKKIKSDDKKIQVIDGKDAFLSVGFFDMNVNFGEPGYETKEDIQTGTAASAAGGFTAVAVQPNTNPPIHSRSEVALIVNSAKGNLVDVLPIGTVSKKREGNELAELYDMKITGAVAYSDGTHSIQQAGLMSRALLYAKGFGGLIMAFPEDDSIAADSKMNEGEVSTYLGMKGIPNLAESVMISRDLFLAEYNESPIHFSTISTEEGVDLIKKAKAKGIKVTCDVAAHNLVFTDEDVKGFDSNYKVSPPLRTKKDVKALIKGLKDGVIDAVVSQHTPQEIEFKQVEFQIAKNGIIAAQTVLPLLLKAGLTVETIVEKLAINPRKVLGLDIPVIAEGEEANLVLFSPSKKWIFDNKTNKSKSANSPLFGQELTGQVIAVINNNKLHIN